MKLSTKFLITSCLLLTVVLALPSLVQAQAAAPTDPFGTITAPKGVQEYDAQAGGIGLILFVSNGIKAATIVAGVWTMLNFVLAGYDYITGEGDTGAHKKVKDKLTMSVLGLILIVASYTAAGIIGLVLFGDASYILNPRLQGPQVINQVSPEDTSTGFRAPGYNGG